MPDAGPAMQMLLSNCPHGARQFLQDYFVRTSADIGDYAAGSDNPAPDAQVRYLSFRRQTVPYLPAPEIGMFQQLAIDWFCVPSPPENDSFEFLNDGGELPAPCYTLPTHTQSLVGELQHLPSLQLPRAGPQIMVTPQLSGCCLVYQRAWVEDGQVRGPLLLHVFPAALQEPNGSALEHRLQDAMPHFAAGGGQNVEFYGQLEMSEWYYANALAVRADDSNWTLLIQRYSPRPSDFDPGPRRIVDVTAIPLY